MSDSEDGDFLDQEAVKSSDGEDGSGTSSGDSEEEEDEEGDIEGLINENVSDQEGEGDSSSDSEDSEGGDGSSSDEENGEAAGEKKRKKRKLDDRLEEEDYDLIAENTGIQIKRAKFRRVHLLDSDDEGGDEGGEKGGAGARKDVEMGHGQQSNEMEELTKDVFGDSDEEDAEGSSHSGDKEATTPVDDEQDYDDFIVDDNGQSLRRKRGDGTYTEPSLIEAQEIFGLDFDLSEFEQVAREGLGSEEEQEEDEDAPDFDEYDSDLDGEYGATPSAKRSKKVRRRKKKKKTTIYDVYEPSELERGHFLEKDAEIRVTDIPERFQTRSTPVQKTEDKGELEEEARWIYEQAFLIEPISKQPYFLAEKQRANGPRGAQGAKPQQSTVPKIKEALNLMRNHSFEIPYIANYRREYVEPELDIHDLWKIWQWDEKWMQLNARKQSMRRLFERTRDYQFEKVREQPDKVLTEDTRPITEEDFTRLDCVMTTEELADVHAHFSLYYGRDIIFMQNSQVAKNSSQDGDLDSSLDAESRSKDKTGKGVRQANKNDFYAKCQENGLGSLAAKYGLTAEQFGENLRDNYQRHETEQHTVEPEESAEDYVQTIGFFSSMRAVLQGACHMVAMQIACEPLVRQALRQVYQSRAVLNVSPTKIGKKMLDDSHPCYSMKYLRNKPVRELKGEEFLKLVQAENERLIEMKISVDLDLGSDKRAASSHQTYFEEIRQLFYRDEYSLLAEKWNAQRAQAVAHALLKVLYPLMEKELRSKLLSEAKEHVLQSCVHKLRKWLDVAPLQVKRENESLNPDEGPYPRVIACSYLPDKSVPAFCCFLDTNGEVNDFLRLGNLLKRKHSPFDREREEKEKDLRSFKRFVVKKRPDMIVVSAESRECSSLVDEFKECLEELESEEDMPLIPVELMDPNVARIFSKTTRAQEAFPEYPELLKLAISLGRRMQEPLHVFTSLFSSPDNEYLALNLHPLQSTLPVDQLKSTLEIEIVNKVNDVGVDVNFAMEHPHTADMLQYVCGLGPRKAPALIKNFLESVRKENIDSTAIQNRSQLVMLCSIGPQMFINCAAFIKIDTAAFHDVDNTYIEVLDSTRIHPETYEWARKMAVDALEYEETGDDTNPSSAVEDILLTPEKLRDLDLDAFAEELERQEYGNKKATLYDIRDELFGPFKERRAPYSPMSQEEKFILLTGETPESLYEGKLVTCTVVGIVRRKPSREVFERANPVQNEQTHLWQCPFCLTADFVTMSLVWQHFDDGSCAGQGIGVRTRLENGLSGFIHTKNISDKHVNAPEERVHIGMTIHCRILRVNLDKFSVDLTCKTSDLLDKEGKFSPPKDIYFDYQQAEADKQKDEATKARPKNKMIQRVIVHPSFKNCTYDEAEKSLSKMDQGEVIFRPSSKGMDHLTLTWKVDDGIHQHIDIREEGKPNQFSLGKQLFIGNEEYEDLDEILARFVQPMAANARDLVSHKYYRKAEGGNKEILRKLLKEEKSKNPKRIPYLFSTSKELPGKFLLSYQPGTRPRYEFITVTTEGFRYRNTVYGTLDSLLKWFKLHFQDPIPKPNIVTPSHVSTIQSGTQIPSRITPNMESSGYSGLSTRGASSTPYTPTHLAYATPTPQYGQQSQQQSTFAHPGGSGYQNQYNSGRGQYGQPGQYAATSHRGNWNRGQGSGWSSSHGVAHTPGGGRTPAYTPTQTPQSMVSDMYGATPTMDSGRQGMAYSHRSRHRREVDPMGTPLLDE